MLERLDNRDEIVVVDVSDDVILPRIVILLLDDELELLEMVEDEIEIEVDAFVDDGEELENVDIDDEVEVEQITNLVDEKDVIEEVMEHLIHRLRVIVTVMDVLLQTIEDDDEVE